MTENIPGPTQSSVLSRKIVLRALWFQSLGSACCADEIFSAEGPRYDIERFGFLPCATPEESDLLIINGAVNSKLLPELRRIYERMKTPRFVIAVGSCACSGGMFGSKDGYNVVGGIQEIIPINVFVPGCPPRPEAIMNGIL
jgi:NADH-quinone oxidoreductase subunit B